MIQRTTKYFSLLCLGVALGLSACGPAGDDAQGIRSVLQGRLTVNPAVDSIADYAGFEVLVAAQRDEALDTLAFAVTDSAGAFRTTVTAPEPGIYPLVVSRRGQVLRVGELAVAHGDTATVEAQFPLGSRLLRVRSPENAAWMAYRNTKAQYNQATVRLLQEGAGDRESLRRNVVQTSTVLWSLRQNFPNTIGAEVASAESVAMLEGWDDSLVVARTREIEADNPSFVDVVRAARRAQARLEGQEAALALVRDYQERVEDPELRAALQSEIVIAHLDSLQTGEALAAARTLQERYGETAWAEWAERAVYEVENLSPGSPAPDFLVVNREGRTVTLDKLEGRLVLLEFYRPEDETFQRQLDARNALFDAARSDLTIVSVSAQPDTLLNDAFSEGRYFPGVHVIAPAGLESQIARAYNVRVLPTRILIGREGEIIRKYVGSSLLPLQEEVLQRLERNQPAG